MFNALLISTGAIVGIVVAVVAVILVIALVGWWISMGNALIRLKNKVEEAWATIDVFLKKRYDLIPNLVETVKGYSKHESETLQTSLRREVRRCPPKRPKPKWRPKRNFRVLSAPLFPL